MILNSLRSCCSFTDEAVGFTALGCCAMAGVATASSSATANAPMMKRACARNLAMPNLPDFLMRPLVTGGTLSQAPPPLRRDGLAIRRLPAPRTGAVAALGDALLVDLRDDLAVASEQRLGRAHLRAQRQLAFGQTVGAVGKDSLLAVAELGERAISLGTAGAVGALVHLAARP